MRKMLFNEPLIAPLLVLILPEKTEFNPVSCNLKEKLPVEDKEWEGSVFQKEYLERIKKNCYTLLHAATHC